MLMTNRTRMRLMQTALGLATAATLLSCATTNNATRQTSTFRNAPVMTSRADEKPITTPASEPETMEQFGARVCKQYGPGHGPGSSYILRERVEDAVTCEDHGGYTVRHSYDFNIRLGGDHRWTRDYKFNYPKPKVLTLETQGGYMRTRSIVLFGEEHDKPIYAETFAGLIPKFKEFGFTHIGLELDYSWQKPIDKYMANPTKKNRKQLVKDLGDQLIFPSMAITFARMIDEANKSGLKIVCLDNNPMGSYRRTRDKTGWEHSMRDQHMKAKTDSTVKEGGRIAIFLGAAHVAWTRETPLSLWSPAFKPVARYLVEEHGREKIGLIDLHSCDNPYIFTCFPQIDPANRRLKFE